MLLYRLLLHLYPASWRAEFAREMCLVFAARRREASGAAGVTALWLATIPDLFFNAVAVQWDVLRQDLRYTLRTLFRTPGFAATAIAIAGIGIGATTSAFTMLNHVLLQPFPYKEQNRIVKMREDDASGLERFWDVSPANYRDWKRMSNSFENMGAFRELSVNMTGGQGPPLRLNGASLTAEVLPILGVKPLIGRYFSKNDDAEGAAGTVVLSYGLWQEQFGGDPGIAGRKIELDNTPYTVIGVMPKEFYFPYRDERLWTAMRFAADDFVDRTNTYIFPVARLKRGVSLTRAQAEMRTIAAQLAHAYPKELENVTIALYGLRGEVSDRTRLMLMILLGASGCVLLISCLNLANLLIARAMVRRRELGIRAALGAGRERLVRQTLTESLLLAFLGGLLGLLLADGALPLLAHLVPASLPLSEIPIFDARVLMFALAITFATGILFGVMPAVRTRVNAANELHQGGRSGIGGRRERLRSALVIGEVACSILLLVGFGLLMKALWRIQAVDPGFRPDHVLTLETSLAIPRYENVDTRAAFYQRVLEETDRIPGVRGAAYTSFLPMVMPGGIWPVEIQGHPENVANRRTASLRFITPGFFPVMGIPLLSGHDIRESDNNRVPYVALVSRSFVQRYWPGENPVGRHINIGNQNRLVIGVVGDIRNRGPESASEPQVYASWLQPDGVSTWYAPKDLVIRTTGDPLSVVASVRRIIRAVDPTQPISDVQTLTEIVAEQTSFRRIQLTILGAFGAAALLLAAVGIHGLLAFAVSTRTQEIGVRIALGARRIDIFNMTLGEGMKLAAIGILLGVGFAYGVGHLLQSLLANVKPSDPGILAVAIIVSLGTVLAGSFFPALRAVRVDAMIAMRAE